MSRHVATPVKEPRRGVWRRIADGISRIPLRTRIGLLVMLAVGFAVSVAAGVNYFTVRQTVLHQVDATLSQNASPMAAYSVQRREPGNGNRVTFLVDASGNSFVVDPVSSTAVPLSSTNMSSFQNIVGSTETAIASGGPDDSSFRTVVVNGVTYRLFEKQTTLKDLINGSNLPVTLVTAQSMADTDHTLGRLAISSLLVAFSGILLAGVAGFSIGRAGLRPVEELTEATEFIARTGELTPIEVRGHDELARLATSFNSMLGALARSREYQKRLVADAGHELRTPLTSMRTNIDLLAQSFELAESGKLSATDRDELIGDVKAQMSELSMLVNDLVELSRDEPHAVVWQDLDLVDVVNAAAERVRRRAAGLHFVLRLDPWYLHGDEAVLERAVTNLLDNAAKFSPPGGTVAVDLHSGLLQVSDEGPGIAEADLSLVFDRFYRSSEARSTPGSGLGLAIVKQAIENHGGRVSAGRAPSGGALLSAWLPGSPGAVHGRANGTAIADVTPPTTLPPGGASY